MFIWAHIFQLVAETSTLKILLVINGFSDFSTHKSNPIWIQRMRTTDNRIASIKCHNNWMKSTHQPHNFHVLDLFNKSNKRNINNNNYGHRNKKHSKSAACMTTLTYSWSCIISNQTNVWRDTKNNSVQRGWFTDYGPVAWCVSDYFCMFVCLYCFFCLSSCRV